MEIKIDTEKDSKQDLIRVIHLLQGVVNNEEQQINNYELNSQKDNYTNNHATKNNQEDYTPPSEGLFGLFDDDSTKDNTTNDVTESKFTDNDRYREDDAQENDRHEIKEEKEEKIDIIPY